MGTDKQTTETIIKDGLAAMADEMTFRRWIAEFDCVLTGDLLYSWSEGRKHFGHSLPKLAFKLRDKCQETCTASQDYCQCLCGIGDRLGLHDTQHCSTCYTKPEHWIIAAIAALEGE